MFSLCYQLYLDKNADFANTKQKKFKTRHSLFLFGNANYHILRIIFTSKIVFALKHNSAAHCCIFLL